MLLHIGYSKTGTTTLQRHIFPQLGRFIGKDGEAEDVVRLAAIDLLLGLRPKVDLPEADVCSYEIMLRPGDIKKTAQATAEAFPMCKKLFISIRRQDDLVWSQYLHDLKIAAARKHQPYTFAEALENKMLPCPFPACTNNCLCGPVKKIPLPFYDFEAVRRVYAKHFDVLMLPLELLSENSSLYLDLLSSFVKKSVPIIRQVPAENPGPSVQKDDHQLLLAKILEAYAPSNSTLSCPVNLSRFGYF